MLGRHFPSLRSLRKKRKTLKMNKSTAANAYLRYDWPRLLGAVALFVMVAAIAIMIAIMTACTPSQRSTMSGAFATCAEGDLGALVSPGVTIIDDVTSIIKGNGASLEADLSSLAVTFGLAIIECAIAAVESVLMTPPATGSGAGSGSGALTSQAKETPPGIVRARAWAAQQHQLATAKKGAAK